MYRMNIQDTLFQFGPEATRDHLPLFYDQATCKNDADLPYIKIAESGLHAMEIPVERFFRPISKVRHVNYTAHGSSEH